MLVWAANRFLRLRADAKTSETLALARLSEDKWPARLDSA
jgi:hypothetical protein